MATALIVGGSGGIGRAAAAELVDAGHTVILAARNAERLRAVADGVGVAGWVAADGSDEAGASTIADAVEKVDAVVHVAGTLTEPTPLRQESAETFDDVLRANLLSAFLVTKAILPKVSDGGRLVFVSSTAERGLPRFGVYSASKGGLRAMVGAWAGELAADGVNVSVLSPGPVDTSMFQAGPEGIPLLDPHDVAQGVRFLVELHPGVTVEEITMRANRHHGAAFSGASERNSS